MKAEQAITLYQEYHRMNSKKHHRHIQGNPFQVIR